MAKSPTRDAVVKAMNNNQWQSLETITAKVGETLGRTVKQTTVASAIRQLRGWPLYRHVEYDRKKGYYLHPESRSSY